MCMLLAFQFKTGYFLWVAQVKNVNDSGSGSLNSGVLDHQLSSFKVGPGSWVLNPYPIWPEMNLFVLRNRVTCPLSSEVKL